MYENKLVCSICGGEIAADAENINGTCLGCGNVTLYPKSCVKGLNRITYLRNTCDFERAYEFADGLVKSNPEDSEAYWARLLCEYGIQYVREGSQRSAVCRKDTCALPEVKESESYKKALYYATQDTAASYEAMGNAVEEAVKNAQSIIGADKECDIIVLAPEDISVDNDLDGEKLYLRFKENLGFNVFYAPETAKDMPVAGKAAVALLAVKKAKILLAVFRNEKDCNNGYMKSICESFCKEAEKEDSDKIVIPVFNASEISFQQLPECLVWADDIYDTSDSEFMREISEKVEGILKPEEASVVPDAIVTATAANKENLVKRAYMFLEDGEFETADTYFDKILDIDIEDSRAYIGKLLAECKLKSEDEIPNLPQTVTDDKNYIKALRFATPEQRARYEALNGAIVDRIEGEKARIAEERQRLRAEREAQEEIERARRARQQKEERKLQYQRRREPLRKTLLEVREELGKTFITPKRKAELKEQEATLVKNISELDAQFPDIFD